MIAVPGRALGRGAGRVRHAAGRRRRATEEEIIEHVRGRLARFKAPKTVTFGELPKTSTGKIQKFVLRDQAWAGSDRRIR